MKKFATMLLALLLTAALTVPAMATFTPSSENKDAPEIISATFEDGTDAKSYLIVTPYSKRNSADPSIKESLERAYEDVKNASTLDKLNSDVNTLLKNYPHVKAEDLVASDLFDLSYVENGQLAPLPQRVTVTFRLTVPVEDLLFVMTRDAEGNWHLLNMTAGLVTKVSKNQVTVTFDSTGPVLFIINTASMPVDKDGPKSPQTGEISPAWVIAGMTVVAACAAAYLNDNIAVVIRVAREQEHFQILLSALDIFFRFFELGARKLLELGVRAALFEQALRLLGVIFRRFIFAVFFNYR